MKANERPDTVDQAYRAAMELVGDHGGVISHAAQQIDVAPSALWQLVRKQKLLPGLARQMAALGMIELTAVRHRRCAEFTKERAELFDQILAKRDQTLSQWMNEELDKWLANSWLD